MENNLIKVIGLMIKLRNFWVALAIGCAFSMGTTSCGDDDDEDEDDEFEDCIGCPYFCEECGTCTYDE